MTTLGLLNGPCSPVRPQDITEGICAAIQDMLIQGQLALGSRLPEVELSSQLGVSRPSLREAFRILQQQGLISIEPRKGATVMHASSEDLHALCEYRACLEDMAIRIALPKLCETDYSRLEMYVSLMSVAAQASDTMAILEADMNFHQLIYDKCDNPYLLAALKGLSPKVRVYSFIYRKKHSQFDMTWERHQRLLAAYRSGDVEVAATANRHHVMVDSLGGSLEFLEHRHG